MLSFIEKMFFAVIKVLTGLTTHMNMMPIGASIYLYHFSQKLGDNTKWVKKQDTLYTVAHNFAKRWPIFKMLSPSNSAVNM